MARARSRQLEPRPRQGETGGAENEARGVRWHGLG